jgi:hypothetical protein
MLQAKFYQNFSISSLWNKWLSEVLNIKSFSVTFCSRKSMNFILIQNKILLTKHNQHKMVWIQRIAKFVIIFRRKHYLSIKITVWSPQSLPPNVGARFKNATKLNLNIHNLFQKKCVLQEYNLKKIYYLDIIPKYNNKWNTFVFSTIRWQDDLSKTY